MWSQCKDDRIGQLDANTVVSLTLIFVSSRNAPPNIVRGGALRDEKRLRGRLPILLQLLKSDSSINYQTTQKRL